MRWRSSTSSKYEYEYEYAIGDRNIATVVPESRERTLFLTSPCVVEYAFHLHFALFKMTVKQK